LKAHFVSPQSVAAAKSHTVSRYAFFVLLILLTRRASGLSPKAEGQPVDRPAWLATRLLRLFIGRKK